MAVHLHPNLAKPVSYLWQQTNSERPMDGKPNTFDGNITAQATTDLMYNRLWYMVAADIAEYTPDTLSLVTGKRVQIQLST